MRDWPNRVVLRHRVAVFLDRDGTINVDTHYPYRVTVLGLAGAEQAAIVGLVYGTIFAVTGRIWMLMVAHAAFDLTALAIIYYDLETAVAHLVFK